MTPNRPRILFVAMQHSIHTARWVDMMTGSGYDMHMFAIDPAPPHDKLRNVTLHVPITTRPTVTRPAVTGHARTGHAPGP
jgi:hypothetical protein